MSELIDTLALLPNTFGETGRITAGFSLRHGGVSTGPYRSLNLGLSTGDDESNVLENRRRLCERFAIDLGRLSIAGQVHGNRVKVVRSAGLYPGFDGLATDQEDLVLCITSADCAVVLLADVEANVVAACHSGWRGTAGAVAARTLEAMVGLGATASNVRAYVGPCISVEHFEVGPEVAERFESRFVVRRRDWPKPHVDLKGAVAGQLIGAGVPAATIEVSQRCTFRETDHFYSYRAENGRTGRMMGFICTSP